jgi:hypothetical protein
MVATPDLERSISLVYTLAASLRQEPHGRMLAAPHFIDQSREHRYDSL